MNKGTFASDQITESENNYPLNGKVSPNFINEGNTDVTVALSTIKPGGQLTLNFPNHILEGFLSVRFRESGVESPINLLTIYWLKDTTCK